MAVLLYPKKNTFIQIPDGVEIRGVKSGLAKEDYRKGVVVSTGNERLSRSSRARMYMQFFHEGEPTSLQAGDRVWIAPFHGLYLTHRDFDWIDEECELVVLKADDYAQIPDLVLAAI